MLPNCASQVTVAPRDPDVHRSGDLGGVAAGVVAVAGEHLHLPGVVLGRDERRRSSRRHGGRRPQRDLLAATTDPSGSRACTGFGSQRASVSVKYSPSKLVTSWVSRPRTHWIASSTWRRRTGAGGKSMPYASVLVGQPPAAEAERRPVRPRAGRSWPSRWPARPDAGSRPSRRGCRTERATWSPPARRGWRPPRGRAGSRCRRPRRSGPRSRSSRTRDPRSAARGPGARGCSCSAAPCALRTSRGRP